MLFGSFRFCIQVAPSSQCLQNLLIPFLRYTCWRGRRDGSNQFKCKNARNRQVQVAMACGRLTVLAPKGDVRGHRPQGRHFYEEKERKEEGTMRETTYLWQARRDQPYCMTTVLGSLQGSETFVVGRVRRVSRVRRCVNGISYMTGTLPCIEEAMLIWQK